MSFFICPKIISQKNSYFAAANTTNGFYSYFDSIFCQTRKIIIKGGPGTGKSTLMKTIYNKAIQNGMNAECFYCSSDTNSLDAVSVNELNISIIDGTPPHSAEPLYPGAYDEIINLGDFWDDNRLKKNYRQIKFISDRISGKYKTVYSLLRAAYSVNKAIQDIVYPYIYAEKLYGAVARLIKLFHAEKSPPGQKIRLNEAFGTAGAVRFDSYEQNAQTVYVLHDKYNIAPYFLETLSSEAEQKGLSRTISYEPLTSAVNSIFIESGKSAFVMENNIKSDAKVINTERFISKDVRSRSNKLRSLKALGVSLCSSAADELEQIGKEHDNLEEIYISSMNFERLSEFTENLTKKIFSQQNLQQNAR